MNSTDQQLQAALAHHRAGQLADAEKIYRQILASNPTQAHAIHYLGVLAAQTGHLKEADAMISHAIALQPGIAEFHVNLAMTKMLQSDAASAEAHARIALSILPRDLSALSILGAALKQLNRHQDALDCCRRMLEINPNSPEAHANMGITLTEMHTDHGQLDEAETALRKAIELRGNYPEALTSLGMLLTERGKIDEAIALHARACELQPGSADCLTNLANSMWAHGRIEEATATYQAAMSRDPNHAMSHSSYLLALNYDPKLSSEKIFDAHRDWGRQHAARQNTSLFSDHDANPSRRLRVGYHGLFLRTNPPTVFMEQAFANRNREQVEVTIYNEMHSADSAIASISQLVDRVRNTSGMNDHDFAAQIRDDQIDILVDLFGHTTARRMKVFGSRLAPVQITYLGYCNTTGMDAMDYFITDAVCDPPGYEQRYIEKLMHLPGGFCCFSPPSDSPPVNDLPALHRGGQIAFGSLHALPKINRDTIRVWAELLRRVPHGRLLIVRNTLTGSAVSRLQNWFAEERIDADRVEMRSELPQAGHWALYHEIDISLDVLPWSGHTTTCESLWMGVPMITQMGNTHAGRMVASVLTHCGRPEWIAENESAYFEIAGKLAGDIPALADLRSQLRAEFASSAVCDGKRFTAELEAAFRDAWKAWCGQRGRADG